YIALFKSFKSNHVDDVSFMGSVSACQLTGDREKKRNSIVKPIIKGKALILYNKIGGDDVSQTLTASEGWLHHWKKRHGIREVIISSEKLSAY
ncbi:hypothetical protein J6590_100541, partial [Homalodisca vitripennis]